MNKPHVLLPEDFKLVGDEKILKEEFSERNRGNNWKNDYEREVLQFQSLFSGKEATITREQYEICDYYWGFSNIKTKEEVGRIYKDAKSHALSFINSHR